MTQNLTAGISYPGFWFLDILMPFAMFSSSVYHPAPSEIVNPVILNSNSEKWFSSLSVLLVPLIFTSV